MVVPEDASDVLHTFVSVRPQESCSFESEGVARECTLDIAVACAVMVPAASWSVASSTRLVLSDVWVLMVLLGHSVDRLKHALALMGAVKSGHVVCCPPWCLVCNSRMAMVPSSERANMRSSSCI